MADLQQALEFLESGTFDPKAGLQIKPWEYYDNASLVSTQTKYQFFKVPNGQQGKVKSDTNFPLAGQMPESEKMSVMYLGIHWTPDANPITQAVYQNIVDAIKNSYLTIAVQNQSPQVEIPLLSMFDFSMPIAVTGGATGDQVSTRDNLKSVYPLDVHIPLASKTTFNVEIQFDVAPNSALDGHEIMISLIGPRWSL